MVASSDMAALTVVLLRKYFDMVTLRAGLVRPTPKALTRGGQERNRSEK